MSDANEIRALQASLLGALDTAAALAAIKSKVMAIGPDTDISSGDLEELGRLTLANAVSSQALRGLVEAMRSRREVS
jgi:hypothetical protein